VLFFLKILRSKKAGRNMGTTVDWWTLWKIFKIPNPKGHGMPTGRQLISLSKKKGRIY
jgi:hypothetical protein